MKKALQKMLALTTCIALCLGFATNAFAATQQSTQDMQEVMTHLDEFTRETSIDYTGQELSNLTQYPWLALCQNLDQQQVEQLLADSKANTYFAGYAKYALCLAPYLQEEANQLVAAMCADPTGPSDANDALYGLMAVDIATDSDYSAKRQEYIDFILADQNEDGLFSYVYGGAHTYNTDTTAAVVCALAPYVDQMPEVKQAVTNAVTALAKAQTSTGNIDGGYGESPDSTAVVIYAMCALGINPDNNDFFEYSLIDGLMSYITADKTGFCSSYAPRVKNSYTTYGAFMALTAYQQLLNGNTTYNIFTKAANYSVSISAPQKPETPEDTDKPATQDPDTTPNVDSPVTGDPFSAALLLPAGMAAVLLKKRKAQ